MCGRFALKAPASAITEIFQVDVLPDLIPRYNIPPTSKVATVRQVDDGSRELAELRWGLIPSWAKDKKIGYRLINARGETVRTKPSFRSAFKRRRLLILADGFYEWHREGKKKIPHLIGMRNEQPFAMAGIWERWKDKETEGEIQSCSIITTGPNELMEQIHNRMPVILPPDRWDQWLDPTNHDTEALEELLVSYPADEMKEKVVNTYVNNVKNKGPDCQEPPDQE
jgi:putative SOS response-associated peptidase YedK